MQTGTALRSDDQTGMAGCPVVGIRNSSLERLSHTLYNASARRLWGRQPRWSVTVTFQLAISACHLLTAATGRSPC